MKPLSKTTVMNLVGGSFMAALVAYTASMPAQSQVLDAAIPQTGRQLIINLNQLPDGSTGNTYYLRQCIGTPGNMHCETVTHDSIVQDRQGAINQASFICMFGGRGSTGASTGYGQWDSVLLRGNIFDRPIVYPCN